MLLLLLSFCVHYGLLNCEENVTAKFNESSLVDRQNLLQVNGLLEDLEHKTRKLLVLLADVQPYDTKKETYDILKKVLSEKVLNNQKPKNSTEQALVYHPIARDRAPTSVIPRDPYVASRAQFPPIFSKIMLSTYPRLQIFPRSVSEEAHTEPRFKIQQVTSTPLSTTRSPVTTPSSTIKTTTLGRLARGWFDEIAPYTGVRKKIKTVSRNKYQYSVHIVPYNVTLAKSVSRPRKTPGDPYVTWTTTMSTAGDVLYGKVQVHTTVPPKESYQELMKQLNEGHLVVFGLEMFRLIAVKDKRDVQEVLVPVETIYKNSMERYDLCEVDNPFLTIFGNLAKIMSKDIETMRTYSSMMFHTLLQRKKVLSPEVNSMIDQAGLSYKGAEGRRLLRSLTEFEDYPLTNKSSFSICENLVEGILQPLQRPADSKSRQELLYSINKALRQNYPDLLSDHGVGTPTTLSLIGTTISKIVTQPRRIRMRKRRLKPRNYDENRRPRAHRLYLDYHQPSLIEDITTTSYNTLRPTNAYLWSQLRPTNAYLRSIQRPTNAWLWNYPMMRIPKRKIVQHPHKKRQHALVALDQLEHQGHRYFKT